MGVFSNGLNNAVSWGYNRFLSGSNHFSNFFHSFNGGFSYGGRISPEKIMQDGLLSNDTVYSVIHKLASVNASMPWKLQEKATQNGRKYKDVDNGELFDLLDQPNDYQTTNEYLYTVAVNLLTTGDSFIYKPIESIGFLSGELLPIPTSCVKIIKEKEGNFLSPIAYYELNLGGQTIRAETNEIIHIKYQDPTQEGYSTGYGLSPMQSAGTLIKSSNNRNVAESSIFENRGATGIISGESPKMGVPTSFSANDKIKVDEGLKERIGSAKNFNKLITIKGAAKFTAIGMSPTDLKIVETQLPLLRRLCNIYSVPSEIFNDVENVRYNSAPEAYKALYHNAIFPMSDLIISAHQRTIIKEYGERENKVYKWSVLKDEIAQLLPDPTEVKRNAKELYQAKLITLDEAREMMNYEKLTPQQIEELRPTEQEQGAEAQGGNTEVES